MLGLKGSYSFNVSHYSDGFLHFIQPFTNVKVVLNLVAVQKQVVTPSAFPLQETLR